MRDKLENQIIAYFDIHPEEDLTVRYAMQKFDASQPQVSTVLSGLVDKGILRVRREKQPPKQWINVYERRE